MKSFFKELCGIIETSKSQNCIPDLNLLKDHLLSQIKEFNLILSTKYEILNSQEEVKKSCFNHTSFGQSHQTSRTIEKNNITPQEVDLINTHKVGTINENSLIIKNLIKSNSVKKYLPEKRLKKLVDIDNDSLTSILNIIQSLQLLAMNKDIKSV